MLTYTYVFIFATLLLIQTHQSVPEEGGANGDTWKNSDGLNSNSNDVEYFMPSTEERESLLTREWSLLTLEFRNETERNR